MRITIHLVHVAYYIEKSCQLIYLEYQRFLANQTSNQQRLVAAIQMEIPFCSNYSTLVVMTNPIVEICGVPQLFN